MHVAAGLCVVHCTQADDSHIRSIVATTTPANKPRNGKRTRVCSARKSMEESNSSGIEHETLRLCVRSTMADMMFSPRRHASSLLCDAFK